MDPTSDSGTLTASERPSLSDRVAPRHRLANTISGLAVLIVVGAAVWTIYGPALHFPFIFDDMGSIVEADTIRTLWPLSVPLSPAKNLSTSARPLVNLSLAVNYRLDGLDPAGYRVFGIATHVLTAGLLFGLLRCTLRMSRFHGAFERDAAWISLAVTLIWATHPLQTEAVVYVIQRTELMVALFYVATLYAALRWQQANNRARRNLWLAVAGTACAAGMACKEIMVSAPILVLIYDRTFISGSTREALRRSWPLYVTLSLSWIVLLYLTLNNPRSASAGFGIGISPVEWWLTQCKVLMVYLKLVVWPWPLVIHRQMPYLQNLGQAWMWVLPAALLIGLATVAIWRRLASGVAAAVFFFILAPTLVVPLFEVAAERRMYLPLAAAIAVVVAGIVRLIPQGRQRIALILVAAAGFSAACMVVSSHRVQAFRDSVTLWQDAVRHEPNNSTAHTFLGASLVDAGRVEEGLAHHRRALELKPDHWHAMVSLGAALTDQNRSDEALVWLSKAAAMQPDSAIARINLGVALARSRRLPEAIQQFKIALELNPHSAEAHNNLGLALAASGRTADAIEKYQQAIAMLPEYPTARYNLGIALLDLNRPDQAIAAFEWVVRHDPQHIDAWMNLATAYAMQNQIDKAVDSAERALQVARARGNTAVASRIESWLTPYRTKQAR